MVCVTYLHGVFRHAHVQYAGDTSQVVNGGALHQRGKLQTSAPDSTRNLLQLRKPTVSLEQSFIESSGATAVRELRSLTNNMTSRKAAEQVEQDFVECVSAVEKQLGRVDFISAPESAQPARVTPKQGRHLYSWSERRRTTSAAKAAETTLTALMQQFMPTTCVPCQRHRHSTRRRIHMHSTCHSSKLRCHAFRLRLPLPTSSRSFSPPKCTPRA